MSISYKHKRTSTASKRPTAAQIDIGEIAVNYDAGTAGLFIEDSSGNIVKVGPIEVSGTAPNSSPAGSAGNSTGEMWLDTSTTPATLKVYNGTAWQETNGQASSLDGPVYFTAQANGALALGDVVYISGAAGDTPIVTKAQANSSATMPAFGFAAEPISSGSTGQITTFGSLEGDGSNPLDTSGLTVNDVVYVSATTAGGWTTTKPTGEGNLLQNIGRIQRVNSQNGVIKVGGAGRASATPNLNDGNIFIGNASNEAITDAFTDVLAAQSGITTNASDLTVDRHILPDTTLTYDLGSSTQRFRDIYLSTNSIDLGGTTLSIESGTLEVGSDPVVTSGSPSMTGNLEMKNEGEVRFLESDGNGTEYVGLKAPTSISTGSLTYTLPGIDGSNGQVLKTNGSGILTWTTQNTEARTLVSPNGVQQIYTNDALSSLFFATGGSVRLQIDGSGSIIPANDSSQTLGDSTYRYSAVHADDVQSALFTGYNEGELRLFEATGNGTSYMGLKAPASVSAAVTLTLPDGDGSANQVLQTDGAGNLSWTTNTVDKLPLLEIFVGDALGNTSTEPFGDVLTTVTGISLTLGEITITGRDLGISNQQSLNLYELAVNGSNAIELRAPATLAATTTYTLPEADGSAGQVMTTDGSANLSFSTFGICAHASWDGSAGGSFNWSTDKIAEGNITSVVRTDTGKYTINFDNDFASAAYTAVCTAGDQDHSGTGSSPRAVNVVSRSAGSMDIVVERTDDAVQDDDGYIAVMVIGVLA